MTPYPNHFYTGLDRRQNGAGWGNVLVVAGLMGLGVFAYFIYQNVWAGLGPTRGAIRAMSRED